MSEHPDPWWLYRSRCERVVDGDTQDYVVDLGFATRTTVRVRLRGVDTAEVYGVRRESAEYRAGKEQSAFVESWLRTAAEEWSGEWPLVVATTKDKTGKYGRYLGRVVRRSDGDVLNDALRERFAV